MVGGDWRRMGKDMGVRRKEGGEKKEKGQKKKEECVGSSVTQI